MSAPTVRRCALALSFSLLALPAGLHAQGAGSAVARARLARALDAATVAELMPVLEDAESRGLPTGPMVDKALYGATRRVPTPRIRAALASLALRMQDARSALAPAANEAEIAAGADALAVGVPSETLRAIRKVAPDRSIAVSLGVLTQLVAQRVPVERASTLVVQFLRKGATPAQLVAFGDDVQTEIAQGTTPDAALDLRARRVTALLGGATQGAATATDAFAPGALTGGKKP